jgi:hypothetical protein
MFVFALLASVVVAAPQPRPAMPVRAVDVVAVPLAAHVRTSAPEVVDPKGAYSNVTTFSGSVYRPGPTGGTGTGSTYTLVDDLTFTLPSQLSCQTIRLDIYNQNAAAVTARILLRFWSDSAGNVGTYYVDPVTSLPVGYQTTLTLPAGPSHAVYTFDLGPGFAVAAGTTTLWAGVQFDNVGTSATPAEIEGLGQGLYNPPDVGASGDFFFRTTSTADSFNVNSPTGGYYWFSGTPVANFGWELVFPALPVELASFSAD